MRYAKLIDGNLYFAPKTKDGICNYNLDVDRMVADGYKPLIEAERLPGFWYDIVYVESDGYITEIAKAQKTPKELEEEKFKRDFFNTSLGYVRRKVYIQGTGETKDFISDVVPRLREGVKIITYNADGTQNRDVAVTQQFIDECDNQFNVDFYGEDNENIQ